jgi:hypothetical protein
MIQQILIFILLICCSVSGCWRLVDPGGCGDWEILDYTRSAEVWSDECPQNNHCFVYMIEACPSTLGLRFYEENRLPNSKELQNKTQVAFLELLQSTGGILASCDISRESPPVVLPS